MVEYNSCISVVKRSLTGENLANSAPTLQGSKVNDQKTAAGVFMSMLPPLSGLNYLVHFSHTIQPRAIVLCEIVWRGYY